MANNVDPRERSAVMREALAVVVIALGLVGLLGCTWMVDPWLFGALASATVIGGGVYLGLER